MNQTKKSKSLKLATYKLQRSELCLLLGSGIHGDEKGRLALVPVESEAYQTLLANPLITKKKTYSN